MPSTSPKQARFMSAVAHNPKFASKAGVPQSVGKDFHEADKAKGTKFNKGGSVDPSVKSAMAQNVAETVANPTGEKFSKGGRVGWRRW